MLLLYSSTDARYDLSFKLELNCELFYSFGFITIGAICAGFLNYSVWYKFISLFEKKHNLTRGQPGSELSAMIFCEYFPNPAIFPTDDPATSTNLTTPSQAFFVEAVATCILVLMIFTFGSSSNTSVNSNPALIPLFIGLTVNILISCTAAITQTGLNPARDFGPRIVAYAMGWGDIAIPGPQSGYWVYIVGPIVGAPVGYIIHLLVQYCEHVNDEKIKFKLRQSQISRENSLRSEETMNIMNVKHKSHGDVELKP